MTRTEILDRIRRGRTDLIFELLALPEWREALHEGQYKPMQWFVYYGDLTALKAVLRTGNPRCTTPSPRRDDRTSYMWSACLSSAERT